MRYIPLIASACILFFTAASAMAAGQPFGLWLEGVKEEAAARGVSDDVLEQAFSGVAPLERVIALDRQQPESTMSLHEYLQKVVPQSRIDKARALYRRYRETLEKVSAEYGVQPQYIVALWGIESNFGERMGDFSVVEALATLAYDGRRSEYFRRELLDALTILQQGHVSVSGMQGSWAGAMGQCQFMPSSFLRYAVDEDGDGHKDIWGTEADVFASIANYLHSEGWDARKPEKHTDVLLKWNRSRYFAAAVRKLANHIVGPA